MARMHARRKGVSGSTRPLESTVPITTTPEEVQKLVVEPKQRTFFKPNWHRSKGHLWHTRCKIGDKEESNAITSRWWGRP